MTVFLVHHGEKRREPGDPGLTALGHRHAAATGAWARDIGVRAVISSPRLRTRQTAGYLSEATGVPVQVDERARERMEWDGTVPIDVFAAQWARASLDRDFVPEDLGDCSHAAAQRLWSLVAEAAGLPGPAAIVTHGGITVDLLIVTHGGITVDLLIVTHGGITVDLLRTLLGDAAVPDELIREGTPSCAITTIDGTTVTQLLSVDHLTKPTGTLA